MSIEQGRRQEPRQAGDRTGTTETVAFELGPKEGGRFLQVKQAWRVYRHEDGQFPLNQRVLAWFVTRTPALRPTTPFTEYVFF